MRGCDKMATKWCHWNWAITGDSKKHRKVANRTKGNSFKHVQLENSKTGQ